MEKLIKVDSVWIRKNPKDTDVIITWVGIVNCKFKSMYGNNPKEQTMRKSNFVLDYNPMEMINIQEGSVWVGDDISDWIISNYPELKDEVSFFIDLKS